MNTKKYFYFTTLLTAIFLFSYTQLKASDEVVKSAYIEELDDVTFADAMQGDGYLLVNYYTEWLPPSGKFMPVFKKAAEEMHDILRFATVNLQNSPETKKEQNIYNVQTTVLYKDGEEIDRLSGPKKFEKLNSFILTYVPIHDVSIDDEGTVVIKNEDVVIEITEENFNDIIASGITVVDFYANWCRPCRLFAPVFEETAKTMHGEILFGKVNIDKERDLLEENEINAIPTVILFKEGQEVKRHVGPMNEKTFKSFIQSSM